VECRTRGSSRCRVGALGLSDTATNSIKAFARYYPFCTLPINRLGPLLYYYRRGGRLSVCLSTKNGRHTEQKLISLVRCIDMSCGKPWPVVLGGECRSVSATLGIKTQSQMSTKFNYFCHSPTYIDSYIRERASP